MEKMQITAGAKSKHGEEHQREVGSGTREGHPAGAARMAAFPYWVVRRARPSDHASAGKEEAQKRENHHSKRRAPDVGNRIKAALAAESRGGVSPQLSDKRVGSFVAGGGKEKDHVGNEPDHQHFGGKSVHDCFRF